MTIFWILEGVFSETFTDSYYSDQDNGAIYSSIYNLLPSDLRTAPSESLGPLLTSNGSAPPLLSPSLPTLLLFECVLVYMPPAASTSLVNWFVDYLEPSSPLGAIVYEMFGLDDAFGRMMLSNLKKVCPSITLISVFKR